MLNVPEMEVNQNSARRKRRQKMDFKVVTWQSPGQPVELRQNSFTGTATVLSKLHVPYSTSMSSRNSRSTPTLKELLKKSVTGGLMSELMLRSPSRTNTWQILIRVSKVLVMLTCTAVCLYFLGIFVALYRKFHTVVDVSVEFPDEPSLPAISVCTKAVLKNVICKTDDGFCENFNSGKSTVVNRDPIFDYQSKLNVTLIQEMTPEKFDLLHQCTLHTDMDYRDVTDELCGTANWFYYKGIKCYAINTLWYDIPISILKEQDSEFRMILNFNLDAYLNPNDSDVDVYVHNPRELPNERTTKFPAKPGQLISVGISKSTVTLLEPPYATMCQNYTKNWHQDKSSYLCEDLCLLTCMMHKAEQNCSCVPNCLLITRILNKCMMNFTDHQQCCANVLPKKPGCKRKCPPDCTIQLYDILVDVDTPSDTNFELEVGAVMGTGPFNLIPSRKVTSPKNLTLVTINLQAVRHLIYTHKAKITPIEILGYVGGYLGVWMGVSIPLLYERFLDVLVYCRLIVNLKKQASEHAIKIRRTTPSDDLQIPF